MNKKNFFTKKMVINIGFVVISALLYSISMNSFVRGANLFPGGFAGLSRLISEILFKFFNINIPFSPIFFGLNFIITVFLFNKIGKKFLLLSILWYSLSTIFTAIMPVNFITDDMLLLSVFGGIINGFAIGIALKNNASSGGTDFIAIYFSMKKNMPMWNNVMILNALILTLAGFLFGWDKALYSIIYQYCSTQILNALHNRFKLSNLFIITSNPDEVSKSFYTTCRHGITKINAEGEYSHTPKTLLFSTIHSYELNDVISAIKKADPKAFISINTSEKIIGNYYQKPIE